MNAEETKLAVIHDDMQGNVYGENVGMNECSASDFMTWYNWRMNNFPVEHITANGDSLRLSDFDILSAVDLMAEWVKAPFSLEHKPTNEPTK